MRILWLSNAPFVGSGYGEQSGLFIPRLAAHGHEVAVAANYGINGVRLQWNGLDVYPSDNDWGNQSIAEYAKDHDADLVIALCDAWVLKPPMWPDIRMAVWAPIDHYPIPPGVLAVLAHERVRPIAMSRFGETLMAQAGLDPVYVPHGVNTGMFNPRPHEKADVRRELNIPEDAFLVGMVAANKGNPSLSRKGFPQAFHAFSMFAKDHPDAYLYVHTEAKPKQSGGIDLDHLAQATGCNPDRICFPPERAWQLGMSAATVAAIYQSFDVLLNPSMGEGFGIPILEAQASGVPVIVSDHSAMSELCGSGWKVGGDPWWDALQESFMICPSIDKIHDSLDEAYEARDDQAMKDKAVEFAQAYDADLVTERYWLPALEKLAAQVEVGPIAVPSENGQNQRSGLITAPLMNRAERRRHQKAGRP